MFNDKYGVNGGQEQCTHGKPESVKVLGRNEGYGGRAAGVCRAAVAALRPPHRGPDLY